MNAQQVETIVDNFSHLHKWLKIPATEKENQALIRFAKSLRKEVESHQKNTAACELLRIVYKNIARYEKKAYPPEVVSDADVLAFFMDQHGITQSELPEIGSQSHVCKILKGERSLTKKQIVALAKRFNVSTSVFLGEGCDE